MDTSGDRAAYRCKFYAVYSVYFCFMWIFILLNRVAFSINGLFALPVSRCSSTSNGRRLYDDRKEPLRDRQNTSEIFFFCAGCPQFTSCFQVDKCTVYVEM